MKVHRKILTTLKGDIVQHPLAITVHNEGTHYDERVALYKTMTHRQYRAYLLKLVCATVRRERNEFNVKHSAVDVATAVAELHDSMKAHVDEWEAMKKADLLLQGA